MRTKPLVFTPTSRRVYLVALTALIGLTSAVASASENGPLSVEGQVTVPASPEHGKVPVSSQFRFPDDFRVQSESTKIVCQVLVSRVGEVSARKCAQHGGSERLRGWLRNEIHYRLERSRFRPAQVDGERVAVSMPILALVSCDAKGDCGVGVYPNAGLYTDRYGAAYYGPQEIIDSAGTWYDRMVASDSCRSGKARTCKGPTAFAFGASVRVSNDGYVNGVGVLDGIEAGDFPVDAALERLVEARYIPAQVQGEAMQLLVHTPTLHKKNSRHFARNQCRRVSEIGTRLGKHCYTMQELAAYRPDDESGFAEALTFWLVGGSAGGI
ncbi:MAG: hypothetical protein AAGA68_09265 [Pseudomonadota bacterium]